MRPRVLRRRLALVAFGAILAGAAMGTGIGESVALVSYPPSIGCAAGLGLVGR